MTDPAPALALKCVRQLVIFSVTQLLSTFELQYLGNYISHWAETWNLVLFWPKLWIIVKKESQNSDFFTS